MRRLEPVVRRALRGRGAPGPGEPLVVAVSGGADSVALLVALHALSHEHELRLHAAHLHHGLRGRDADADRESVRELCDRLQVPLTDTRIAGRTRLRRRGLSGEAGLRTLRREWLARVARRTGARLIATAHTADDQLETVLLRLARGAGLAGLGGMRARHGAWWKPLLEATRHDVEHDLRAAGIAWREDATNRDVTIARNRVRHVVVPALLAALHGERATREQRAALARRATAAAGELRAARVALNTVVRGALRHARREPDGTWRIAASAAAGRPLAVRRALVEHLWARANRGAPALARETRDALARALAGGRGGRRWALPGGGWAGRSGADLHLHPPGAAAPRRRQSAPRSGAASDARTKTAGDAILRARSPGRRRPAHQRPPDHRDAGPVAPVDSSRRTDAGPERTP